MSRMEHVVLNGDPDRRYPGNLNFSFAYVEGKDLMLIFLSLESCMCFCYSITFYICYYPLITNKYIFYYFT